MRIIRRHVRQAPQKHVLAPVLSRHRLREIREELGLLQRQMAPLVGYGVDAYRMIETGQRPMTVNLRHALKEGVLKHLDEWEVAEIEVIRAETERLRKLIQEEIV